MLDLKEVTTLLKYNGIHATSKKLNVKKSAIHQFLKSNGLVYKDGCVEVSLDITKTPSNLVDLKTSASHNSQIKQKKTINITNYETSKKEKKKSDCGKISLKNSSSQSKKNTKNNSSLKDINIEKLNYLLENINMEKLKLIVNNSDEILEMLTSYRILKSQAACTLTDK